MVVSSSHELAVLSSVLGGVSAVGSAAVVLSYVLFKECRSLSRHLVSILALCDVGQGLFFMFQNVGGGDVSCKAQALFGIFIACASFCWTACIAYFVHRVVAAPELNFRSLMPYFHAVSWGYPLVFCILLATLNPGAMQPNSDLPWCFLVNDTRADTVWRLFAIFIPLFVSWAFTLYFYVCAINRLRRLAALMPTATGAGGGAGGGGGARTDAYASESSGSTSGLGVGGGGGSSDLNEVRNKLMVIPLCFIVTRFWGALLRMIEIPDPSASSSGAYEWLQWLTAIGDPLQGLTNALVFVVFTRKVRAAYYTVFCRCRCRCRRPATMASDTATATHNDLTDDLLLRDSAADSADSAYQNPGAGAGAGASAVASAKASRVAGSKAARRNKRPGAAAADASVADDADVLIADAGKYDSDADDADSNPNTPPRGNTLPAVGGAATGSGRFARAGPAGVVAVSIAAEQSPSPHRASQDSAVARVGAGAEAPLSAVSAGALTAALASPPPDTGPTGRSSASSIGDPTAEADF